MTLTTGATLGTALVALLFAPLAAQTRGTDNPGDRSVPFAPGETLHYDVSWSDLLTAGSASLAVRDRRASYGGAAWYIVAEGQPSPLLSRLYALYYKADTLLDTRLLLPQRGSVFSREGRRERMKEILFDHRGRAAVYRLTGSQEAESRYELEGPTHDALSAIFALRSMSMQQGAATAFRVADSGNLYQVSATVEGRESLRVGSTPTIAWKVVPTVLDADGRPFGTGLGIWFADDDARTPLRLQATLPVGTFVLTLSGQR